MNMPPFLVGRASEYNHEEGDASEDLSNWTEAAPDYNLLDLVYDDTLPDLLMDEYEPARGAGAIEAENAIEQFGVVEAVEDDAAMESELADQEEEDRMCAWYAEEDEDEDGTIGYSEESSYEDEDEDVINEGFEEAILVPGEEGLAFATEACFQDAFPSNPDEEERFCEEARALSDAIRAWIAITIEIFPQLQAFSSLETGTELAGERVTTEDLAEPRTRFMGTRVAEEEAVVAEEPAEENEAMTTRITVPASSVIDESNSNVEVDDDLTVIAATEDSTVPSLDTDPEAILVSSPMTMVRESTSFDDDRREFPH